LTAVWAVLFVSCAATPPGSRLEEAGLEVPPDWSSLPAANRPVDPGWMRRFGDRRLDALIAEAEQRNPDLKIAASRVAQAAEQARIVASAGRPNAFLGFGARRTRQNFIGYPDFGGGAPGDGAPAEETVLQNLSNTFGPSLDISWEVDVWGRIRQGTSAAMAEAQGVEMDFAAARTSLAAQVAKAWFALAEAEEQNRLAAETLQATEETERALRDRFRAGQADGQIVGAQYRLAKSDTASARAALEQAAGARDAARRQLETLVGRPARGTLVGPATLPAPPPRPPAGLPSDLLLRRPDVRAAERRFAASGKKTEEARRALFPQFKLTATTGTSTDDLGSILDSDFGVWTLAGNVVQPILTGGRLRAEIRVREEQDREAVAALQKAVLQAFGEVETALAADAFLARRESALKEAVALANEADSEARAAYRDGVGDILTVFATQNRRLATEAQAITVRRLRLDNRINLHLALGGDYTPKS
jgi:NodT family efflux transporter outer membrane factor (OMF) lipoprotein